MSINCLVAVLLTNSLGFPDVPIEGDFSLIQVALVGQRANHNKLEAGEMQVEEVIRPAGSDIPVNRSVSHVVWHRENALIRSSCTHYFKHVPEIKSPAGPVNRDSVEKSQIFTVLTQDRGISYHPSSRFVIVDSVENLKKASMVLTYLDQRPSTWYRPFRSQPVEELLGPHPNIKGDWVKSWKVSKDGDFVHMDRVNKATETEKESTVRATIDMSLDGHLIDFGITNQQKYRLTMKWVRLETGEIVLKEATYFSGANMPGELIESKLTVKNFKMLPFVPPETFTIESLRIPAGTRVDDRITGKSYSYKGRKIEQKDLDKLIERGKQSAKP